MFLWVASTGHINQLIINARADLQLQEDERHMVAVHSRQCEGPNARLS